KSAEAALREHVLTTSKWQLLKTAMETSSDAYEAIEREIELKATELRKLGRIRRVSRFVRKRAETEAALRAFGEVISFDANAFVLLESAAQGEANAASRIATLT